MYSIYDYYGMSNDLQNRYDAAKSAGTGQSTQIARSTPTGNNAPFLPVTSIARSTPTGNNAPFLPVTSTPQTTQFSSPQVGASIYDSPTGEGGSFSPTGSAYTSADLANYPSPSWMEPVANTMFNLATGIADMAVPGLGFAMQQGRAYSMDPTNYSLGRSLTSGALNYGLNYGVNRSGLMGELTKGISTGNRAIDTLSGLGIKGGVSSLINDFVNFVTGSIFGPAPSTSRGHNNMAGFDDETYGYSSTAGYGGAPGFSSPTGQTGEVDQGYFDTGGGSGESGWGGPSGDWSGDAWGDSYY